MGGRGGNFVWWELLLGKNQGSNAVVLRVIPPAEQNEKIFILGCGCGAVGGTFRCIIISFRRFLTREELYLLYAIIT